MKTKKITQSMTLKLEIMIPIMLDYNTTNNGIVMHGNLTISFKFRRIF